MTRRMQRVEPAERSSREVEPSRREGPAEGLVSTPTTFGGHRSGSPFFVDRVG